MACEPSDLVPVKINVGISEDAQSKVHLGETIGNATPLYWDADDEFDFKVKDKTYNFVVSEVKSDPKTAQFVCYGAPATLPAGTYTATYPSGFTSIPYMQAGVREKIDLYYHMTAVCNVSEGMAWEDIPLTFKSEAAIVRLTLTHVDFAGNTSGNVRRTVYKVALNNDGKEYVRTMDGAQFTSDSNGTVTVCFVVPAETTFTNATVTAVCDARKYMAAINSANTLKAGKLYNVVKEMTCTMPSIETRPVDNDKVTATSAVVDVTVTDEGLSSVVEKGIVWSTSYNPSLELDPKVVAGRGSGDFSVTLNSLEPYTLYYVRGYATNSEGTSYGSVKAFRTKNAIDYTKATDLSASGSANSYIVPSAGSYKFKAVKGNSLTSVGACSSLSVLWESFGNSNYLNPGSLIALTDHKDGYVYFKTNSTYYEGNAVIAAHDADGRILWSWHVWMTNDEIKSHVHTNRAGTMMDRNLGALSADPKDRTLTFGLLYQWGRKDPFLSGSNAGNSSSFVPDVCRSTNESMWTYVQSDQSTGTIQYTIENPMTFITSNYENYDWYYTGDYNSDVTRWAERKTIYDPCPPGWKLPKAGRNSDDIGVWGYIPSGNFVFDWTYDGVIIPAEYCGSDAWYPAAGFRNNLKLDFRMHNLEWCGRSGQLWSCTQWVEKFETIFTCLSFTYNDKSDDEDMAMSSQAGVAGADGNSVRCAKE